MSDPLLTRGLYPPGSCVHGIPQARIREWVSFPPPGHLPGPEIESRSLPLLADSLFFYQVQVTWFFLYLV